MPAGRQAVVILAALIAAAVFLAFWPALGNEFTNWDDQELVYGNPQVRGLDPAALGRIFTRPHSGPYVPLTVLSYALEYRIAGLNPFVFHLTNVLLHAANVLLAFWLMRLLLKDFWLACLAALLFGLHPLRVESVAWVTERKDVLAGFFFLAAVLVFVQCRAAHRRRLWFLIPPLFLLAGLAKPVALVLPAALLLLDYWFDGRLDRRTLWLGLVLALLALPLAAVNIRTQVQGTDTPAFHLARNFLLGSRNLVWYAGKILVPAGLSPLYPYPAHFPRPVPAAFYLALPALAAAAAVLVWSRRHGRALVFGGLWYLALILPVSQYFPVAGPALCADRYTYLPALGLAFLLARGAGWLDRRLGRPGLRHGLTAALAVLLFVLALQTRRLCRVWQNSLTLWNEVLRQRPNYSLALNNRGRAFSRLGHYSLAIRDYDRAIQVDPEYELPYYNRAVAYEKLKSYDRALADYDRALGIRPDLAIAFESRGAMHSHLGRHQEALEDLNRALELDPSMDVAYLDRGFVFFKLGLFEQALADYDRALEHDPYYPETYLSRGDVRYVLGDGERAIADYTKALALNPAYDEAYYNRAVAYKSIGEYDRALADYDRALEINPGFAKALNNRGNLHLAAGAFDRAIADYDRALKLEPAYAEALYNRAAARELAGDRPGALADLLRAESLGFPVPSEFLLRLGKPRRGPSGGARGN